MLWQGTHTSQNKNMCDHLTGVKKMAEEWQGQTLTGRVPHNHVRSSRTDRNLVRNMKQLKIDFKLP